MQSTTTIETRTAAEALLASVKGIARAHVEADEHGRVTRVHILPDGVDDRAASRNAQSALMAVLGQSVNVNAIMIGLPGPVMPVPVLEPVLGPIIHEEDFDANVVELRTGARRSELQEAARVAFDTLRAAQANFHGYHFEGADLVRIAAQQYVVVAVRRSSTDGRYCGAAPVVDSVSTASARALMNAVGVAAMGASRIDIHHSEAYESLKA